MKCGLLGEKLSHSYSPQIHAKLGEYSYALFEKTPDMLDDFLKHGDFWGLNITIPYKKAVIPYCATLSHTARMLGAVNTIIRKADGSLMGHNTDYYGFTSMLRRSGFDPAGKKCLVLGSGGASATVEAVLRAMDAKVIVISRTGEDNYGNISRHYDASLIVNTTPVGMYPNNGNSPVDLNPFTNLECVLDLIYNPAKTKLLLDAQRLGIPYMNGLWMLIAQAKESAEWFTGKKISDDIIEAINRKLKLQMENIILIGMPGCGKSTIAAQLAKIFEKEMIDSDAQIVSTSGKSIPEIFSSNGEEAFRKIETDVLADLGKRSGLIIATGGGCVTIPQNEALLKQNGVLFWIRRDIHNLPKEGRPLSQTGNLEQMYQNRAPMYSHFADHIIHNNSSVEEAVMKICQLLEV